MATSLGGYINRLRVIKARAIPRKEIHTHVNILRESRGAAKIPSPVFFWGEGRIFFQCFSSLSLMTDFNCKMRRGGENEKEREKQ